MQTPLERGREREMLKVMNAKLAGEPGWKLWVLHQVARLLRVPIRVRGMPYGAVDARPFDQSGGWQQGPNVRFGAGFAQRERPPQPIFEIYGRDGRAWKIHENGVIEGFEEGCLIVNRIAPKLAALRGGGNG